MNKTYALAVSCRTLQEQKIDSQQAAYTSRTERSCGVPPACVHFVGFRGEEYWSAWRVWGDPEYVHIGWDLRARREIAPEDIIVFANGAGDQPPRLKSYPDLIEPPLS